MTRTHKRGFVGGLAVIIVAFSAMAGDLSGEEAPDFALKSMDGRNLRLSEYRGDVVMLNFWASWCGSCRQAIPELDDMFETYRSAGFTLLGVNIDDHVGRAEDVVRDLGVSFPVLLDHQKKVSKLYDVRSMPVTMLIDRNGVVRFVNKGYRPGAEKAYVEQIRGLLRE